MTVGASGSIKFGWAKEAKSEHAALSPHTSKPPTTMRDVSNTQPRMRMITTTRASIGDVGDGFASRARVPLQHQR